MSISYNITNIKNRMSCAAKRCGRDPTSIRLVAVSKTKSFMAIREAALVGPGHFVFGENYAQELHDKALELTGLPIEWHFIGHLQKNKIKYLIPMVACIETIDSIELANAISKRVTRGTECFIEVNIEDEKSKSGITPAGILPLAEHILTLPNLNLQGLMMIPPFDPNPEKSRPYFKKLRELLDKLNGDLKLENLLCGLSMGMSHDFEIAIEEGATIVRIGTAIFGGR